MIPKFSTVVATVYSTVEYDMFKTVNGNRDTNNAHLIQLRESISKRLLISAAIVNDKMEIIDGQHRHTIAKELKKPFYFYIVKDYGLAEVQTLNTNNRNWNSKDFVESYIEQGNEDYSLFKQFKEKYGFGQHETVAMLQNKHYRDNASQSGFKNGFFRVKSWTKATAVADKIFRVKEYYVGYKRAFFVFAMLRVFTLPNYDHDTFLQKLKYQSGRLKDSTDVNQYLEMIEEIYNHRNADKINIRQLNN